MNDENMKELLALMCLVDWIANDLHYESRGACFYEKHLLADRVRDLGDDDELKEAYWLGFKNANPPKDVEIAAMATTAYSKMGNADVIEKLVAAFDIVVSTVEQCKTEQGLPSGIHSILDEISKKALTCKFLTSAYLGH